MQEIHKSWIKLKETVDKEDCQLIDGLKVECTKADGTSLKLELDYKLGAAAQCCSKAAMKAVNELMYFDGEKLIGYIGIGNFGGAGTPPELNGMVHPAYRRQGVFQMLSALAIGECRRQNVKSVLLLSDRLSTAGLAFIDKTGARYHHSEFEMYLRKGEAKLRENPFPGIIFRKAINADAYEVARQNAIYFGEEGSADHASNEGNGLPEMENAASDQGLMMPEEEEKKGMTIYFAVFDEQVIGKVHLQLIAGLGGIYGLGVLPQHRGKGFGRAILLGVVERLKEAQANEIMLQVATENANALHLYESCGFETTSTMDYYEMTL